MSWGTKHSFSFVKTFRLIDTMFLLRWPTVKFSHSLQSRSVLQMPLIVVPSKRTLLNVKSLNFRMNATSFFSLRSFSFLPCHFECIRTVFLSKSVCPSVRHMCALWQNEKKTTANISMPYESSIILVFQQEEPLIPEILPYSIFSRRALAVNT